jgi:hypothetical protein
MLGLFIEVLSNDQVQLSYMVLGMWKVIEYYFYNRIVHVAFLVSFREPATEFFIVGEAFNYFFYTSNDCVLHNPWVQYRVCGFRIVITVRQIYIDRVVVVYHRSVQLPEEHITIYQNRRFSSCRFR